MFFRSFDTALYYLGIPSTLPCLLIYEAKYSYEHFTHNGKILYCIGQGPKSSHGHPSGNQSILKQIFLNLRVNQDLYPAFRVFSNCVEYMGNYRLVSFKKVMSFEGFVYFEYKLFRFNMTPIDKKLPAYKPKAQEELEN
jgi:hypothetical protein